MEQTTIQWLLKILEGQKDKPFDYDEWKIAFEHALEMEKEQIKDAYILGRTGATIKDFNETFKSE